MKSGFRKSSAVLNWKKIIILLELKPENVTFFFVLVTNDMKVDTKMKDYSNEKCKVQNLTCVSFPTRGQCHGVSFGGCACKQSFTQYYFTKLILKIIEQFKHCFVGIHRNPKQKEILNFHDRNLKTSNHGSFVQKFVS